MSKTGTTMYEEAKRRNNAFMVDHLQQWREVYPSKKKSRPAKKGGAGRANKNKAGKVWEHCCYACMY